MLPVMRWLEYPKPLNLQLTSQPNEPTTSQTSMVKSQSNELNELSSSPSKEEANLVNNSQEQPGTSPRNGQGDPAEYRAVHREWIKQKR